MSLLGLCVSAGTVGFVVAFFLVLRWSDRRTEPGAKAARVARQRAKRARRRDEARETKISGGINHRGGWLRATSRPSGKRPVGPPSASPVPGQPSTAYEPDQTMQPGDET